MSELESELERRTVTYTLWNQSAAKMDNKAWHPVTYNYADASPKRIKEIKVIIFILILLLLFKRRYKILRVLFLVKLLIFIDDLLIL